MLFRYLLLLTELSIYANEDKFLAVFYFVLFPFTIEKSLVQYIYSPNVLVEKI